MKAIALVLLLLLSSCAYVRGAKEKNKLPVSPVPMVGAKAPQTATTIAPAAPEGAPMTDSPDVRAAKNINPVTF